MSSVSFPAPLPALPMATAASLQGQRSASARALEQAAKMQAAPAASSVDVGRALVQAIQAAPDMLGGLTNLHQAREAYARAAETLRGADARAAAMIRWSL